MDNRLQPGRTAIAGCDYFAVVFVVGFVLGMIRTSLVAPWIGALPAEILEAPLMVAASLVAARRMVCLHEIPYTPRDRIGMGLLALVLMMGAEIALTMPVRGVSYADYFEMRDPLGAAVYYSALALFALMPCCVERGRGSHAA
jgi:hypothetical protein